jgi:hypothetical protein
MDNLEDFSIIEAKGKKTKEPNNKYLCDICKMSHKNMLCDECFKKYNNKFESYINKFVITRKTLSKKIDFLLNCNIEKSKKLNRKINLDKCQILFDDKIREEETKINKYKGEVCKTDELINKQKEKNAKLSESLKRIEEEMENIDQEQEIMEMKNKILEISSKIKEKKKKFIYDLFEDLFIKKKCIIKISDFFNENQQSSNDMNFSIINISSKDDKNFSNTNNVKSDEIKLSVLRQNNILLKRFNSFFKAMILFLQKSYGRFKIKMPYEIKNNKIKYKNNFEYSCELDKELNDQIALNNFTKGLHLLNINYIYLMENIFGDSLKLKNWFDISTFLSDKDDDLGSVERILEESKNDKNEEEYNGFIIVED